jgi:hypothetical protein
MPPRIAPDDPFVGLWLFDEDSAQYQLGSPPHDASYNISTDGEFYTMTMRWTTAEGHTIEQAYKGLPDGQDYAFEDSPGVDSFSMTRVDARTLDTTARKDGQVVSHARRVLSDDGNTMTITTDVHTPQGQHFTNVAIYLRAPAGG